MAWTVTINGNTYTEASFDGYNYANENTGFPAALNDIMYHTRDVLKASCTNTIDLSSLTVSTILSVTVETNKYFEVDQTLLLYSAANPVDKVYGVITAYNSGTGALDFDIHEITGTATHSAWVAVLGLGILSGRTIAAEAAAAASAAAAAADAGTADTDAIAAGNSAAAAVIDAQASLDNKNYSEEWATQPVDVPVTVASGGDGVTTFSSMHWNTKTAQVVAGNVFDNSAESITLGWTGSKIAQELRDQRVSMATLIKFGAVSW